LSYAVIVAGVSIVSLLVVPGGSAVGYLAIQPLQRVGGPDLCPVRSGEVGKRGDLLACLAQHRGDVGELGLEHTGDDLDMLAYEGPGGLGKDGADRGCDHR
jgi:hypothetical protein